MTYIAFLRAINVAGRTVKMARLRELFDHLAAGRLRVVEGETYPMSEVRRAHEDLQARRTTGKVMLDPRR